MHVQIMQWPSDLNVIDLRFQRRNLRILFPSSSSSPQSGWGELISSGPYFYLPIIGRKAFGLAGLPEVWLVP